MNTLEESKKEERVNIEVSENKNESNLQKQISENKRISGRTYIYILYLVVYFFIIIGFLPSAFESSNQFGGLNLFAFIGILTFGFSGFGVLCLFFLLWDCFIKVLTKRK